MKNLISSFLLFAVLCPSLLTAQDTAVENFKKVYEDTLEVQRELFEIQKGRLVEYYVNYLEKLAREMQDAGDLESLIVIKAEQKTVQEGGEVSPAEDVEALKMAQGLYREQLAKLQNELTEKEVTVKKSFIEKGSQAVTELTRQNQVEEAKRLDEFLKEIEGEIAEFAPPPPEEPKAPLEKLGPNLLPDGNFEEAEERHWRVSRTGRDNKTGLYQEPNSGMNKTIRMEQDERHKQGIVRSIKLEPGKTYRITWRARMLRPWRSGVELRGKGSYSMGFMIPRNIWSGWGPLEQQKNRSITNFHRQPPPDREWRTYTTTLKASPWQGEFIMQASPGEGDFLIDDIRVQEILPPEKEEPKKE
jgi:hypothetical protein